VDPHTLKEPANIGFLQRIAEPLPRYKNQKYNSSEAAKKELEESRTPAKRDLPEPSNKEVLERLATGKYIEYTVLVECSVTLLF
jgi:hypothetical protein